MKPIVAMARPIRCLPAALVRIVMVTGSTSPPPTPCSTRNTISEPSDHDRPHIIEPIMNVDTAPIHTRRVPKRSDAHPEAGTTAT
jgi:hypothetical protein